MSVLGTFWAHFFEMLPDSGRREGIQKLGLARGHRSSGKCLVAQIDATSVLAVERAASTAVDYLLTWPRHSPRHQCSQPPRYCDLEGCKALGILKVSNVSVVGQVEWDVVL